MKIVNDVKLYTEAEVADLFGIAPTTIAKYRREGKIKATRIGRTYYFSESGLREYLDGELRKSGENR